MRLGLIFLRLTELPPILLFCVVPSWCISKGMGVFACLTVVLVATCSSVYPAVVIVVFLPALHQLITDGLVGGKDIVEGLTLLLLLAISASGI